jgi:glucokinase
MNPVPDPISSPKTSHRVESTTDSPLAAIEIGGTKLQICVGTAHGHILERHRFDVDRAKGAAGVRAQIASCLPKLVERFRPAAIGVGYGGPVDWRTGRIWRSYALEGWIDFPLATWLSELSGLPAYVENDANTAALGEATCGAGKGCDPVFYVTLGSGVGGGLVIEGRIYHGVSPTEMEIGHMRCDEAGTRIFENHCSGWSVDKRIRESAAQAPDSILAQTLQGTAGGGEARHLAAALAKGDGLAQRILQETAQHLAFALSHVIHLLHPEVLVIGGGLSLLGEALRSAVEKALDPMIMDALRGRYRIALSSLGEDVVPIGALLLVAQGHTSRR